MDVQRLAMKYKAELMKAFSSKDMLRDNKLADNYVEYMQESDEMPQSMNEVLPLHSIRSKSLGPDLYDQFFGQQVEWATHGNGGTSSFIDWMGHHNIITNSNFNMSQEFNQKAEIILNHVKLRDEYKNNMIARSPYKEYVEAVPEMNWSDLHKMFIEQGNPMIKFKMPPQSEYKTTKYDSLNTNSVQIIKVDQIPESMTEPIPSSLFVASVCKSRKCGDVTWDYKFRQYCNSCGGTCRLEPDRDIVRNTYFGTCFLETDTFSYRSLDKQISGTDVRVACIGQIINGHYILLILAQERIYADEVDYWEPEDKVADVGWQIVNKIKEQYKKVFKRDFVGMDIILYCAVLLRIANEMGYKKNILFTGLEGVGKTYAFRIACFVLTPPSLTDIMNCGRVSDSGFTGSTQKVRLDKFNEVTMRKPGLMTDVKMLVLDEYTGPDKNDKLSIKILRNSLSENTITHGLSAGKGAIPKSASCMAIMNPPAKVEQMAYKFLKEYNQQHNVSNAHTISDFHVLMGDKNSPLYKEFVLWARDKIYDYRTGMSGPDNDRFFLAFFCEQPKDPQNRSPSAWDDIKLKKKLFRPNIDGFLKRRGREYFDFASKIEKKFDDKIYEYACELHRKNDYTSKGRISEFTKTIAYALMALNGQAIPDTSLFEKINIIYQRAFHWITPEDFVWTEQEIEFLKNPVDKQQILELLGIDDTITTIIDPATYVPRMA